MSFRPLPALKTGALEAGMLITSFVLGLRPLRAARFFVSNVPKPTRTTYYVFLAARASPIASSVALIAASASFFVYFVDFATASISSDLFIFIASFRALFQSYYVRQIAYCQGFFRFFVKKRKEAYYFILSRYFSNLFKSPFLQKQSILLRV